MAEGTEGIGTVDRSGHDGRSSRARVWLYGLLPLALLGIITLVFLRYGPLGVFRAAFPPIEELTIERVRFPDEHQIEISLVNGGPEPVTVAQLIIDEAYWHFEMEPGRTVPRLGRATIRTPYPWVDGEPLELMVMTNTGLTFSHEVEVATESPRVSGRYLATFALLGLYAGVIPVFLGLLWFPFLERLERKWTHFFLAVTVGLLVFLGVDALHEALETAEAVPAAFQGVGLVVLGALGAILGLVAASRWLSQRGRSPGASGLMLAYMIALGIGLHNLGEGLAIGAAYAVGAISLGAFLVIGFAIHNTTEGFAIVAPLAGDRPAMGHFFAMGLLAGAPTIAGAWLGGFTYQPTLATFFLALGAGAIFQVVWSLGKMMGSREEGWASPLNALGVVAGLAIMYATALLVVA